MQVATTRSSRNWPLDCFRRREMNAEYRDPNTALQLDLDLEAGHMFTRRAVVQGLTVAALSCTSWVLSSWQTTALPRSTIGPTIPARQHMRTPS